MSESDQNWNAADGEPTAATPPATPPAASEHSWPQYTWPATPETPEPAAASDAGSEVTAENATVAWPPTQPNPATNPPTHPYPPVAFEPIPAPGASPSGPYTPNPYATNPYAPDPGATGGAWGPPPTWGSAAPAGWPPVPPAGAVTAPSEPAPPKRRRALAFVAALALVLASAGVGAGVAVAVHDNTNTSTFSAGSAPSDNGNGFGGFPNSGSNGFGNNGNGSSGLGNGTGNNGTGNNGTGNTVPSGSGTLNTASIASKVDPALVNIDTTIDGGRAAGTGMLISSTGEVLTNNHVIAGAKTIQVFIGGSSTGHNAKVVGYDVTEDVALVQITDNVSNLPTVTFGDPSALQVGDPVVAIGNAGGRGGTPQASQGQITALDQQVTAGDPGGDQETLEGMIQINAPIEPGDSGGALIDANGHVIGMNTAAAGGGSFSQGSDVGFAIPIDNAVNIVAQIRSNHGSDKVFIGDRGLLGVQVQDASGQSASGALVVGVENNTGASAQGIADGDVITSIDGKSVTDSASLRTALANFHAGDTVQVGWSDSSGGTHSAAVKLVVGPPL